MFYILIDLERSISTGQTHYWNPAKMGYTTNVNLVGVYKESIARTAVESDFDKRTIMVPVSEVEKILGRKLDVY